MSKDALPRENFPGGDVVPGETELRVSIEKKAYAEILVHAKDESDVEVGGFLLGKVKEDKHGIWLHVQHTLKGEKLENQGAQVKFTHETWNLMYREKDKSHPDLDIVGWYHTHPGFDIFLSEMDKFIHNNWFANPNQVAFVYDPHQGTEGFFRKPKDEIVLMSRFWHGGKARKTLSPEQRIKPATASAVSGGAVGGDVAATVAALNDSVRRLELEVIEQRQGGRWGNVLMMSVVVLAALFLAMQVFGAKPRLERAILVDPRTGMPATVVDPRSNTPFYLELGPPDGRVLEPKPADGKPADPKSPTPKPPDPKPPEKK